MDPRQTGARSLEAGFNLVEAMLALALMGSILLSIFGMFTYGTRVTDRSRSYTTAVAAARDIMEEMTGWPYDQTWQNLGISGSDVSASVDTRDPGFAAKWQPVLDEALVDARAEIRLESLDPTSPPALEDATAIRVTVTVFWRELKFDSQVVLCGVRL